MLISIENKIFFDRQSVLWRRSDGTTSLSLVKLCSNLSFFCMKSFFLDKLASLVADLGKPPLPKCMTFQRFSGGGVVISENPLGWSFFYTFRPYIWLWKLLNLPKICMSACTRKSEIDLSKTRGGEDSENLSIFWRKSFAKWSLKMWSFEI